MPGEHYIEFLDFVSGSRLGISTGATGNLKVGESNKNYSNGFRRLAVHKVQNTPGTLDIDVPADFPLLPLSDKTIIIDWRRDIKLGIDWYQHFVAIYRDNTYYSNKGLKYVTLSCQGLKTLLTWYIIAWPAGIPNRTLFTSYKTETIMKTLVACNGVAATSTVASGRDRDGSDYKIAIETNSARGNTLDWTANRTHTVLEELQSLALIGEGDFDLVLTSPLVRTFTWVPFHDISSTVTFSEQLGNIDNVKLRKLNSGEATAAIVGGQGETTERDIVIRTGANYSAGNNIELFVNATDIDKGATAALQSRGDASLQNVQAREELSFDVVQTLNTAYKRDYVEGDFVNIVKPDNSTEKVQIWGTTISWIPGQAEKIAVEVRTR